MPQNQDDIFYYRHFQVGKYTLFYLMNSNIQKYSSFEKYDKQAVKKEASGK
jgi:hypothetical protein